MIASDTSFLIGASAALRKVQTEIDRFADHKLSVLITGETGTGKELVARELHRRSRRRAREFVVIHCGLLRHEMFESRLFGHRRGAFTGAAADKRGEFEIADGGTVFLDELGSMHLDVQAGLLRVLEDRNIKPVGETRATPVDVRFIAATTGNLLAKVAAAEFRDDLYYRLAHKQIVVPPLRQRREDIPILTRHFLNTGEDPSWKSLLVTDQALEMLTSYSWPGNVRELKSVIEVAAISAVENKIDDGLLRDRLSSHTLDSMGGILDDVGLSLSYSRTFKNTRIEVVDAATVTASALIADIMVEDLRRGAVSPLSGIFRRHDTREIGNSRLFQAIIFAVPVALSKYVSNESKLLEAKPFHFRELFGIFGRTHESPLRNQVRQSIDDTILKLQFFLACSNGNVRRVELFLKNTPKAAVFVSPEGRTPLSTAVEGDHIQVVELLVRAGAETDWGDRVSGRTLLHMAAARGNDAMVRLLLELGADVNSSRFDGWTPLHEAMAQSQTTVVEILLQHRASPYVRAADGKTPRLIALESGRMDLADLCGPEPAP